MKKLLKMHFIFVGVILATILETASASQKTPHQKLEQKTLTDWIELAIARDDYRIQLIAQAEAIIESGVASSTLMDPKLKLGVAGLPVDSFRFDDDPATNISVGLMQQFSRGDTLALNQQKANLNAESLKWKMADRERLVTKQVIQFWFELGYLQKANAILAERKQLMVELLADSHSSYSLGRTETQDVINTELQIAKLDDKLLVNRQMQQKIQGQMSEWLGSGWLENVSDIDVENSLTWNTLFSALEVSSGAGDYYYADIARHPMIRALDSNIASSETDINIAQQAYKPEFGIEVMYAYRQGDNMKGEPASDLVSAYLTVDLPLFTDNRQDRSLNAAKYQSIAHRSNKDLVLSQMKARVESAVTTRINLDERLLRFNQVLLPHAKARTEAVQRGYENNTARFMDYISAANEELMLELERWRVISDLNQANNQIAYLLDRYDIDFETIALPIVSTK